MRAKFVFESLENPAKGLAEFMNKITDRYPIVETYQDKIENFINKSDCKQISFENMTVAAGGFSLSDRVVINEMMLNYPLPFFLYALFHEIAHQYQYKKYGEEKMYEFYLGKIPIEELAKFMQKVELTADEFAIRKCREFVKYNLLKPNEVVKQGNYKNIPINHFIDFISQIRKAVEEKGITEPSKISEFLYNYIKNGLKL